MPQAPSTLLAKPWSLPYSAVLFLYPSFPLLMLTSALTLYPWHLLYLTALNGLHVLSDQGSDLTVDGVCFPWTVGLIQLCYFPYPSQHLTHNSYSSECT